MKNRILLIILALALPSTRLLGNDEEEILEIKKISSRIIFDGICDEPAWDSLYGLPLKMYRPNHGSEPSEKSEIFVAFDDGFFYLGARLHYENGSRIRTTTKKRDGAEGGNDNFGILLDTFNDNENALCFETNPSGLRSDFTIGNDAQVNLGLRPFNRDWNAFWDVRMKVVGNIWHVEFRIPLSTLRFQEINGKVIMGLTVWRQLSSKQEWNVFPLVSNKLGSFSVWKPSQAKKVVFDGLVRKNPVYITPYLLAGLEQSAELDDTETSYLVKNNRRLTGGLDVKYAFASNMTLDLTLNTDFAQVEVDDQVVNLTRFNLFFPEKRQFFVERSSIFTIRTGYEDQLFYSRRIGLYEGEIIPIIGGARLVGRARKWDMGFLDMQTASYDFFDSDTDSLIHLASANHGVFRARKQVFNPTSYAGGMITSRIDASGNYNINAAADLIFNPFRNDYITANYIHTFDNTLAETDQFFNQGKFYLNWLNRSNIGLTYEFSISRAGENFLPEMGFELLENYSRLHGSVGYGWVFNDEDKKMLNQQLFFWTWINKRNTDMVTDISETSLGYNFSMKNGFRANVDIFHNHEFLQEQFDIADDMYFPAGFYDFYRVQGGIGTTSSRPVVLNVKSRFGTYYDGWLTILGPVEVNFKFSPSFNLGLYYQYNIADVTVREQYFRSHLARLKTEFTFTTRLSLLMFFQYSSDDRFGINNIRFRYNPREGNDFYFVYNGDYNTHLTREVPELPLMNRNSFYIKYTYTFIWDK